LAVVILFQKIPFSYYAGNRFSRKKSCGLIPFVNPFPAEKKKKKMLMLVQPLLVNPIM
jgi:hypothetical protein